MTTENTEINRLLNSMGLEKGGIDAVYLRVLDTITAISKYRWTCKTVTSDYHEILTYKIFWRTLREVADWEINTSKRLRNNVLEKRPFERVSEAFPDKEKEKDGRMWLPMHFAVTLPGFHFLDIQTLWEYNPESIKQGCKTRDNFNPCHLAVMAQDPNMALIKRFKLFDPGFGARVTNDGHTPLHLAAQHSNSVEVIRVLIELYPAALEMRDRSGDTPLGRSLRNETSAAPEILQILVDAAPQTARMVGSMDRLPLHLLSYYRRLKCDESSAEKVTNILLTAFPDAVSIRDGHNYLPIEIAAEECSSRVLKLIKEATPVHLSHASHAAHLAVWGRKLENLRYIHSIMPELLLSVDNSNRTPLRCALILNAAFIQGVASLAPDAARIVDDRGNNLLHSLAYSGNITVDKVRVLLHFIPGGALATNAAGQTPYDLLGPDDPKYHSARRLLLLAGAPSSHPGILKQLNYEARKEALFAFFGTRGQDHSGRMDICSRILHGAGATELIRQVVSFL